MMNLKVIAFNGSPRKKGNTSIAIETVFEELTKKNIKTNQIYLYDYDIKPCKACYTCKKTKDCKCIMDEDFNKLYQKIIESEGILLGSPVYVATVSGQMKLFLDKVAFISKMNDDPLALKVGASLVAVRRSGALPALESMNNMMLACQFIIPGSSYWNLVVGGDMGSVVEDSEGMRTLRKLGQNMAWLLEKIQ